MSLAIPLTSASADQGDTLKGGCGFDTNQNILTAGADQGVIYVTALSQEASGTPSTATVTCWIDVNGYEQPGTRISETGTGLITGVVQISFSSVTGDTVTECQQVVFADGSSWTARDGNVGVDCPASAEITDQPVIDLLNTGFDTVDGAACPLFVDLYWATGGGVLGVLRIGADGDLYVADPFGTGYTKYWDCPPYSIW
jgi:hypothetical protein